ncbi:hypothetical protein COCNU_05G006080 [Cocos nucifera]|uniref:Uncharacterized protein n=1 Tax=Cocos nucifera TaxID=13894 RepID=A0A8K0I916_COCNU|nr:hypothetical protein COCNU_05G006080 [Cocos nucifera]
MLVHLQDGTDAMERLTKGLYAQKKRKGVAPGGSSKRTKVGDLSFEVLDVPATALEVVPGVEVPSITEGSVRGAGSQPPASLSLPIGGSMSKPPTERERGDGDDKKKKVAIVKVACKAHSGGSSNSDNDDLGVDPFGNPNIIQDLTDKFALSGERKVAEAECLVEEKAEENENLRKALRKEELILVGLKAALAPDEEKKKEAKIKIAELEVKMSKSILEAVARAMEEFRASSKMKD